MITGIDISNAEGTIAAVVTIAIFAIPLLNNVIKLVIESFGQSRALWAQVNSNTKSIERHDQILDGGLDAKVNTFVQAAIDAHAGRTGNNTPTPGAAGQGEGSVGPSTGSGSTADAHTTDRHDTQAGGSSPVGA